MNFVVLIAGFVHALGGHRMTDALRAAGPAATKHVTTYYRFFSHARWCQDELGFALVELIVEFFGLEQVDLVLDDTLAHRAGKKVALATMHADPLLKKKARGRLFVSYGHVFVVRAVHVRVPTLAKTGWALPVLFRLFEGPSQGGGGATMRPPTFGEAGNAEGSGRPSDSASARPIARWSTVSFGAAPTPLTRGLCRMP